MQMPTSAENCRVDLVGMFNKTQVFNIHVYILNNIYTYLLCRPCRVASASNIPAIKRALTKMMGFEKSRHLIDKVGRRVYSYLNNWKLVF